MAKLLNNGFFKMSISSKITLLFLIVCTAQSQIKAYSDEIVQNTFSTETKELYRIRRPPQQACWRGDEQAELLIKSIQPDNAQITLFHLDRLSGKQITDKLFDTTSLLAPGHYKIYVKAPNYITKAFEIDLENNEKYCLDVHLEKAGK